MTESGNSTASLRLERLESSRLVWAFAISLALHLVCWGGYTGGKKLGLWDKLHVPAWVQKLTQSLAKVVKPAEKPLFKEEEPPLMFVNVSPDQAAPEAPKNAKYYSSKNSQAANPEATVETTDPKITGNQEQVPKTEDAERNKVTKLQPALPADKPQPEERAKSKPKAAPGDLALAKPETTPTTDTGAADKPRPRKLSEVSPTVARPREKRCNRKAASNVGLWFLPSIPRGHYLASMMNFLSVPLPIDGYDLLANRNYASEGRGRVVLEFKLHYDGRITDMKVVENNVTETLSLLCQKAVLDPAPFDKWTTEMRLSFEGGTRKLTFAFYYN